MSAPLCSVQESNRVPMQDYFIGWQCRIREYAMRNEEGRPSIGMRPRLLSANGNELAEAVMLLLLPVELKEDIQQFQYMVLKTHDPQERYKKAIQLFSSSFYQDIEDFDGRLAGLFSTHSAMVKSVLQENAVVLKFDYQQQQFSIPCKVHCFSKEDEEHQFTFWHSKLFNPNIPSEVSVLCFEPDWENTIAEPDNSSM